MEGLAGVTVIDFRTGGVTVSTAVLLITAPEVALMFAVPCARVEATPLVLIVATLGFEDAQVAVVVRF